MRYSNGKEVKYIGLSYEESKLADMSNQRMNNINKLMDVDLDDIDNAKLQMIVDVIEDEYECKPCSEQEEKNEDMRDILYDSFNEIKHRLDMLEDYIDSSDKHLVEEWNNLIKTFNEEVKKIEKGVQKNLKEKDSIGEYCMDVSLSEKKYYPKENE